MNDRLNPRAALALATMLVLCTGRVAFAENGDCKLGQCRTDPNGRGIYVVETGSYCPWLSINGQSARFCPEAFENISASETDRSPSVRLSGRLLVSGQESAVTSDPISAMLPSGTRVHLVGAGALDSTAPSRLVFSYSTRDAPRPTLVQGEALKELILEIGIQGRRFELSFEETQAPGRSPGQLVYQYQGWFRDPQGSGVKHAYCMQPDGASDPTFVPAPVSILPHRRVNGLSGVISDAPSAVTLACHSGAIVTCMNWGYLPWSPALSGLTQAKATRLLGACIQGKRAAYFVTQLDYGSYTREGTPITLQDAWVHPNGVEEAKLEAIWNAEGLLCFNRRNQRNRPDMDPAAVALPTELLLNIPACTPPDFSLSSLAEDELATGIP